MTAPLVRVLDAAVDVAAAYRLTKLLTRDAVTAGLRATVVERTRTHDEVMTTVRWGPDVAAVGGPLGYLVHCPACASVYIAAGVAVARALAPRPWSRLAGVLASSAVIGWLSERE